MADKSCKKQPLSLSDRHNRLLQDISAPSKPASKPSEHRSVGDRKPIKLESLCKVSPKENSNDQNQRSNIPYSEEFTDFNTHEGEKNAKVKVEGLCKVSYSDEDNADKAPKLDESKLADLVDLDSPTLPSKNVIEIEDSGGRNEVTDHLNDLTHQFEILSIEKKRVPKSVLAIDDSPALIRGKETWEDKAVDIIDLIEDESDDSVEILDCFDSENDSSLTLSGPNCTYKLPRKIAKMLYPHQLDGLNWLWSLHCQGKGGILGDDMGLGKTMQICSFLAGLFHSGLIRRALIVLPRTLIPFWIKELTAVGLSEKTRKYFGTSMETREYELYHILQNKGVLLTTYDIVRINSKSLRGDPRFDYDETENRPIWDYVILDEGHFIKNPKTERAKSLLKIRSAHRIIISGTPLQNNLKELWALFNFCCPGLLGDEGCFRDEFENPILHGNDKRASARVKRVGSSIAKELRDRIQPYFLRRLKSEVFNQDDKNTAAKLSQKQEIIVWLRLTSIQRHLYEAFLRSEFVLSENDGYVLVALTILKKICDHPLLLTQRAAEDVLDGMESMLKSEEVNVAEKLATHIADAAETDEFKAENDVSCKIPFIMSLLDNLIPEGHRVLIFSQTRKMLNLIQDSLSSKGYEYLRMDGTTKESDRIRIVKDFQEGDAAPIFLLTSRVGGLGLTLTRADRVIVVDPAWNPSTDNQSVDRAYRIGQKKDVIVYRLMTSGTVEEKIYMRQVFKGGLFKTATEHKDQTRYFSQQEIKELLSLPKEGFDVSVTQQQLEAEHDYLDTVDDSFKAHIEFLKRQGIAGVSHHSSLFSKTEQFQDPPENDEVTRNQGTSAYTWPNSDGKLTEAEIRDKIKQISQTLTNKAMISRLPNWKQKLQQSLAELKSELSKREYLGSPNN